MTEYEILIETINPCGGSKYAKKEFVEAEAESPEAYVAQHGKYPVRETRTDPNGDVVITTGDEGGYLFATFSAWSNTKERLGPWPKALSPLIT